MKMTWLALLDRSSVRAVFWQLSLLKFLGLYQMSFAYRLFVGIVFPVALLGCVSEKNDGIQVEGAWARPTKIISGHEGHSGGKTTTAVYLVIKNGSVAADRLTGAETEVASRVEMHQSIIDENQVMRMRRIEDLPISPGETIQFEPGGFHFMLIGLQQELEVGTQFEMTLQFGTTESLKVFVLVRED